MGGKNKAKTKSTSVLLDCILAVGSAVVVMFRLLNIDEMINAHARYFQAKAPLINPHPRRWMYRLLVGVALQMAAGEPGKIQQIKREVFEAVWLAGEVVGWVVVV